MALHYHGLPLTPESELEKLNGKHVCISYATARKSNLEWALTNAQSIMFDNGAYSAFTQGSPLKPQDFCEWVDPWLAHPHWAVVPDVIDGDVDQQRALIETWPFDKTLGAPVWHLGLALDWLLELTDSWPRICFGSSGEFWEIGADRWRARMDQAFNYLASRRRTLPWIHGLRMLGQLDGDWPLASADSVNVALNYKRNGECPACMSDRIDRVNPPTRWKNDTFEEQLELFGEGA